MGLTPEGESVQRDEQWRGEPCAAVLEGQRTRVCVLRRRDPQIQRPRAVQENEEPELGGNMGAGGPLETADLVVKWIWWPKEDEETLEAKIDFSLEKFSC